MNNSHIISLDTRRAWGKWMESYFHSIGSGPHNSKAVQMSWTPPRIRQSPSKGCVFSTMQQGN